MRKPPDLFMDCLVSSGSIVIDCELCGRTHFADDEMAGTWEEGELEELRKKQLEDPNKYIGHNDSVSWGNFSGYQVVDGCPCGKVKKLENMVWVIVHKDIIRGPGSLFNHLLVILKNTLLLCDRFSFLSFFLACDIVVLLITHIINALPS